MSSEADKALITSLEKKIEQIIKKSDSIVEATESHIAMAETALDKNFLATATRVLENLIIEIHKVQEDIHHAVSD